MKNLFTITFALVLFSCNIALKDNKLSGTAELLYSTNLVPTNNKLRFKINNNIVNRSICLIPYTASDSTNYLYYLSGYTNKICIFNIDSQKLIKTINLEQRGPNGVGHVNGFEIISKDSLFITSNFMRKLYLINSDGKLISHIDYSKYKQGYNIEAPNSRTFENMRIGYKDSKIYLPFYPNGNAYYNGTSPENVHFVAILDTITKTAKTLNIGFPKDYWEKGDYPAVLGFFIYDETFYVNYIYNNKITSSIDGEKWKEYNIPSKYARIGKYIDPHQGAGVCTNFARLVVDPYRKLFYRFVCHEQSPIEGRTIRDLVRYPKKFSIIILNNKMEIIGETKFPYDIYDMHGYFITKEGLYLSLSNPFNINYDEDLLEFQLFKTLKDEE